MTGSAADERVIPLQVRLAGLTQAFVYNGPSMAPTFRPGCLLYVRPGAQDLAPGDVVVFTSACGHVVHRVVTAAHEGWVTRGDNNRLTDPLPVAHGQVVGRVELAEYGGRLGAVAGGPAALRRARTGWAARQAIRWLRRVLGFPYRALRRSGVLRRALGPYLLPRLQILRLETGEGLLFKVLHHGRVVARFWTATGRFECRKPYDLVISWPNGVHSP